MWLKAIISLKINLKEGKLISNGEGFQHKEPGDGAWSRPLYKPKRDRKSKSNNDFYYY